MHGEHHFLVDSAVDAEAVLRPADGAGEHLVGVRHAGRVVTVVVVGGVPCGAFQSECRAVDREQMGRGHDRVEVVVQRRVQRRHVVVRARAGAVDVGVGDALPGADRAVGDVELHRSPAAVREVQAVVGAARGRER